MSNAEFDKYETEYDQMHRKSISASGYEPSFFDEYKIIEKKFQINLNCSY